MHTTPFTNNYREDKFDIDLLNEGRFIQKELSKKGFKEDNLFYTTSVAYCKVDWEFTIEMRSWGVNTLTAYATKVVLEIYVEYYDREDNEFEEEIEVDLSGWKIESEREKDNDGIYIVQNVQFDFKDKTIIVQF